MTTLTVRPARDDEARACRMLLPPMFTPEAAPELLVAWEGGRLVGAGATGTVHGGHVPGLAVMVHVVPHARRRGVGRALLDGAAGAARGFTPVLRAMAPLPEGSGEDRFLEACGFGEYDEIRHFEVDGPPFWAQLQALRARVEASGRVPEGARLVRLGEAPAEEVAALVASEFPIGRDRMLARLRPGAVGGVDLEHSAVLLVDGMVRGAMIYAWGGGVPEIEVHVLHPSVRRGWANALLLEQATGNAGRDGATRFRFSTQSGLADTMGLARRSGAALLRVERHRWRRV